MDRYELFLFVHIVAAIIWLGAGLLIQVQALRAERARDDEGLRRIAEDSVQLSNILFIPASLTVLVFGLLMVIDGPWSFGFLWVSLGLVGYLATFLTGVLLMKPGAEKISALIERDGGVSPQATIETRKLLAKGRIDTVVLYLVVAIMVLKPAGDDVGVLAVMAAVVLLGLLYTVSAVRGIDAETPAPQRVVA
jgi:uncharacterized membrane protein